MPNCYEAQFEKLAIDETGVPLEHLVSCLPGIEIYQGVGCVKYLRWLKSKANGDIQNEGEYKHFSKGIDDNMMVIFHLVIYHILPFLSIVHPRIEYRQPH